MAQRAFNCIQGCSMQLNFATFSQALLLVVRYLACRIINNSAFIGKEFFAIPPEDLLQKSA